MVSTTELQKGRFQASWGRWTEEGRVIRGYTTQGEGGGGGEGGERGGGGGSWSLSRMRSRWREIACRRRGAIPDDEGDPFPEPRSKEVVSGIHSSLPLVGSLISLPSSVSSPLGSPPCVNFTPNSGTFVLKKISEHFKLKISKFRNNSGIILELGRKNRHNSLTRLHSISAFSPSLHFAIPSQPFFSLSTIFSFLSLSLSSVSPPLSLLFENLIFGENELWHIFFLFFPKNKERERKKNKGRFKDSRHFGSVREKKERENKLTQIWDMIQMSCRGVFFFLFGFHPSLSSHNYNCFCRRTYICDTSRSSYGYFFLLYSIFIFLQKNWKKTKTKNPLRIYSCFFHFARICWRRTWGERKQNNPFPPPQKKRKSK